MVQLCVVVGCNNRAGRVAVKRSFFLIPKVIKHQGEAAERLSAKRRDLWLARINRKDFTPSKDARVCSDHFENGKPAALFDHTNPNWAPSLNLGYDMSAHSARENSSKRLRRQNKNRCEAAAALLERTTTAAPPQLPEQSSPHCTFLVNGRLEGAADEETDGDGAGSELQLGNQMRVELQEMSTKIRNLEDSLTATTFTPQSFEGNIEKVKYYTGLPSFVTLMSVFTLVEPFIAETVKCRITNFQKLILTLMRLRLSAPLKDLALRFHVSTAIASVIFLQVIHVLYRRMKGLILWPDRKELCLTMPMEFKKYFGLRVAVIIDCFEIFIERPSGLLAGAETWSTYTHHKTVKFLIGITPQGSVSFLSKGWDGRASDKHIAEHCGLLGYLVNGDVVLADRGFGVAESVGLMCAEVKLPAFTRGTKQLSPLEVETTRKVAPVRIYVERVTGLVRNKYTLLQSTMPLDFLQSDDDDDDDEIPLVDQIVTVCCTLSNLCPSVVPFD